MRSFCNKKEPRIGGSQCFNPRLLRTWLQLFCVRSLLDYFYWLMSFVCYRLDNDENGALQEHKVTIRKSASSSPQEGITQLLSKCLVTLIIY